MKVTLRPVTMQEIINYFNQNFDSWRLKVTNYTSEVTAGENKYFFTNSPMSKKVFIYYNMIKGQIKGEVRDIEKDFQYYSFNGLEKAEKQESFYCVDINSAYLSVLLKEGIIDKERFELINKVAKKQHRLKAVGMFAKEPIFINYENQIPVSYEKNPDAYKWVFYLCVRETRLAMEKVKELMNDEFILYWVDGIFLKGNPEKAIQILKDCGFESKIEKITDFKIHEKHLSFKKDGEQKILFLPRTRKVEKTFIQAIIRNAKKI